MRLAIASLAVAAFVVHAPMALAGPTCEDRAGETVRCEDARAMPLGWTAPLQERLKQAHAGPPDPTAAQLGGVFALILVLFALIALMPDFDGWSTTDSEPEDEGRDGRD